MAGIEETSPLNPIGLHELSGSEVVSVVEYIESYGERELQDAVRQELEALPHDHPETTREAMTDLVAGSDYMKLFACRVVARTAEADPNSGFPFWRKLAMDEAQEVRFAASDALVNNIGRLSLEPKGIASVVESIWAAERRHNPKKDPTSTSTDQ
jgi:hypothetical protein